MDKYSDLNVTPDRFASHAHTTRRAVHREVSQGVKRFVVVVILLIIAGVIVFKMLPNKFPQIELPPAAANLSQHYPCKASDQCLVVYLAPWCGYCRKAIKEIKEIMPSFDENSVGIMVVVGRSEPDKSEAMAAEIGPNTFIDPKDELWEALGLKGVPHWWLVDAQGDIVGEVSGYAPAEQILERLGLEVPENQ